MLTAVIGEQGMVMKGLKKGMFTGSVFHRRSAPYPHTFRVPITMEFRPWSGDDIPQKAKSLNPDQIWRLALIESMGTGNLKLYLCYSKNEDRFTHLFFTAPSLYRVKQTNEVPLGDGNKCKGTVICKQADISPFGVMLSNGEHSYSISMEFKPENSLFLRIDTLVDGKTHLSIIAKVERQQKLSSWDYINGGVWFVRLRTIGLAIKFICQKLLVDWGLSNNGTPMSQVLKGLKS